MPKIKICGLRRYEDIDMANKLKPDYVGFVFAKSKRQIDVDLAEKFRKNLDKSIEVVGVFVDEDVDVIIDLLNREIIDIAQLHGNESEEIIIKIKNDTKKTVIKAISVNNISDILKFSDTNADFVLFDNGKGGTGQTFDWLVLENLENFKIPYFFAGGLNLENITDALKYPSYCVDISGGVETGDFKDFEKVGKFIDLVRK